jgi:hypothetical protein
MAERAAEVSTWRRGSTIRVALKHLLRTPLVWPVNLLLRVLTKSWDSDGEARQCILGIRDDTY